MMVVRSTSTDVYKNLAAEDALLDHALRDLGDPAAIPALTRALADPIFTVRNTAARAILVLTTEDRSLIPEVADEGQRLLERLRMEAGLAPLGEAYTIDGSLF